MLKMLTFPSTLYFPPLMDTHETEYLEHLWLSSCLRPHCCLRISLKDLAESLHSNHRSRVDNWDGGKKLGRSAVNGGGVDTWETDLSCVI